MSVVKKHHPSLFEILKAEMFCICKSQYKYPQPGAVSCNTAQSITTIEGQVWVGHW